MSDSFDLIVVGFGGAGATAAITAHDLGAKVLLLEKAPVGGGSTEASGGNIRPIQNVDVAIQHLSKIADQNTPEDVVAALVHGLTKIPDWIISLGGTLKSSSAFVQEGLGALSVGSAYPGIPGAEALLPRVRVEGAAGTTGGEALWHLLKENVLSRDIQVQFNARAKRLVREESDGRIIGIDVDDGTTTKHFPSRYGVVLACGGFNWGTDFHLDLFGTVLPALTPPGRNTGDGIRLAQDIGADLWHMSAVAARFGFKIPGYDAAFKCTPPSRGLFLIDQMGRRFIDEAGVGNHSAGRALLYRDPGNGQLVRCPSFLIFDETTRLSGPLGNQANGHNRDYKWSEDNSVEISNGWIHKADTLSELADLIEVPKDQFEKTAAKYSASCESGIDEFGRHGDSLVPVATPPYYAIAVWPCLLNTQGGPRRNARAEVLDVWGQPIPGLYSAGELGSLWGALYPGAGNIGEALVTGQIAARNALEHMAAAA